MPLAKAIYAFANLDTVRIPGLVHGLGTPLLAVDVWDTTRLPWVKMGAQVEVDPQTCDVLVTISEAMTGVVVLFG